MPLVLAGLASGGCAASIAAGALGAAVRSGQQGRDVYHDDQAVKLAAAQACRAQAAPHGTVNIIDIEQRSATRAIVWGTAEGSAGRQSFECRFDRKIVGFKLRKL